MKPIDRYLQKLAELINQGRYEQMETEALEIKPIPADGGSWRERHKSVNAFLNTRGGIMVFGVKEEGQGQSRKYVFTGYREEAENKIKEITKQFTDRKGNPTNVSDCFPPIVS
jgi:predicted HTH transcriptional regulator